MITESDIKPRVLLKGPGDDGEETVYVIGAEMATDEEWSPAVWHFAMDLRTGVTRTRHGGNAYDVAAKLDELGFTILPDDEPIVLQAHAL